MLAALWWGWAAYAWLTNHVSGEDGRARLVVFVAMAAMVLVALAVPEAFDAHALLFALAYLVMRMAHLALYWVSSLEDPEVHVAVGRLLPTAITGPAAARRRRVHGRRRCRRRCGSSRWRSTTAARSCAASPATACIRRTSPSASR